MGDYTIHLGEGLEVLKTLADNSVDAVVTDPPYGFSFMGKKWDYELPPVELWGEVLRVLKPGGHLLGFGGARTYHRAVCRIEDAGFEIRDCVMWVYGSGFPKSHNLKDEWQGWGTALKPAHEPIVLARKPLGEGTVAGNVMKWGTGGINVDGCRIHADDAKGYAYVVKRTAPGATQNATGRTKFNDGTIFEGQTKDGRWPANFIHDGSEEVLAGFPVTTSGTGAVKKSTSQGWQGNAYGKESRLIGEPNIEYGDTGSASRFFYCAKASRSEREAGCEGLEERTLGMSNGAQIHGESYEKGQSIGLNVTKRTRNHHPTVKPISLMRYLCRLITPPNGIILDPFMGSGTTGAAAMLEGFNFIGIEREPEYIEIAQRRIAHWKNEAGLFA